MSLLQPPSNLTDIATGVVTDATQDTVTDKISDISGIATSLIPDNLLDLLEDLLPSPVDLLTGNFEIDFDAIAAVLSEFTEFPADILATLLSESGLFASLDFGNIGDALAGFLSDLGDYGSFITGYADDLFSSFGGQVGYLENIIASTGGGINEVVQGLATSPIPEEVQQQIAAELQKGNNEAAAELLAEYSDQPASVLSQLLGQLDVTIAGTIVLNSTVGIFPEKYEIGNNLFDWENGDPQFTFISSLEELHAEIRNITREVTEVVVHSTETYTNANLIAEQIDETHRLLGHDGIGYHYIIRRDGSLQRGRPVDLDGEHAPINSHNSRSIGLAFVGGVNVSTGDSLVEEFSSASSLTREQFNTFYQFLKVVFLHYPGMQILGHNDIDENETDPGFDVIEYVYSKFNKLNLFTDTFTQEPFTTEEINNFVTSTGVTRNDWVPY